jgi:3D (Asp-Asp-Asp) domain-containing protein
MPLEDMSRKRKWRQWPPIRYLLLFACLAVYIHLASSDGARSAAIATDRSLPLQNLAGARILRLPVEFQATAYCDSGITKSGVHTSAGLVAADPKVLPLGSLIHVESPDYPGIYQVMDTGRLVKGKIIDIFLPTLESAVEFGRQRVRVTVLRYGFLGHESGAGSAEKSND